MERKDIQRWHGNALLITIKGFYMLPIASTEIQTIKLFASMIRLYQSYVTKMIQYSEIASLFYTMKMAINTKKQIHLSDNGFMKWSCLICPFKIYSLASEVFWSKHLESVRKDVECAFGILKGRFRCLKLGLLLHNIDDHPESIKRNKNRTCRILHLNTTCSSSTKKLRISY
jgi:hypothetical protein